MRACVGGWVHVYYIVYVVVRTESQNVCIRICSVVSTLSLRTYMSDSGYQSCSLYIYMYVRLGISLTMHDIISHAPDRLTLNYSISCADKSFLMWS